MKKISFSSLKVFLSSIVGLIILVMTVVLVTLSYNSSYNSVEKVYLNQLSNTSVSVDSQVTTFYEQQMSNTIFFSKSRAIIEAVENGKFDNSDLIFKSFASEHGSYENIFISTAESNPRILSAVAGIGTRWGNSGYDDNIRSNLNGKEFISEPQKSPVTGMPVCFFSAPIKRGDKVIGIFGMAVNIGSFSNSIVKDVKVGNTGYPFITTNDGITIAHPNKDFIFKLDLKKME